MTQLSWIASLAEEAVHRAGSRNPFRIAEKEGVRIMPCPDFQSLRGMYQVILDTPFIFLNTNMGKYEARWTLAHELGHHALHREMAENSIVRDQFVMDMTLKPEYEANLYAAHLLYSDREVIRLLREGKSVGEVARILGGEEFLMQMKVRILESLGRL